MVIKYLKNIWFWMIVLPLLYLISGFILLPWVLQTKVPSFVNQQFHLDIALENVKQRLKAHFGDSVYFRNYAGNGLFTMVIQYQYKNR